VAKWMTVYKLAHFFVLVQLFAGTAVYYFETGQVIFSHE
jgi:hypothetical protein